VTEYELVQAREMLVQSTMAMADVQASYIAIYLSMVFAYTTVAYIAGKQLSRLQVFIVTFAYLAAAFYVVSTIVFLTLGTIEHQAQMGQLATGREGHIGASGMFLWMDILIWPLAMIASLVFMWYVRREK